MATKDKDKGKDAADADVVEPGEGGDPKVGQTFDLAGDEIDQVGKDPAVPAAIPVTPGTALDPALPPLEPQKTRVLPEGEGE